jgi:acyl-CoA thioesterase
VAEALVWLVAEGLDGLGHDVARMPEVPGPDGLRAFDEPGPEDPMTMWRNIEGRPVEWVDWESRPPREPYYGCWYRFKDHPTDDAGRLLVLLDVVAWAAAWNAHSADPGYIAPNLDLNAQFHRGPDDAEDAEWLFAEGFSDIAGDGLIGYRTRVWSRSGRLLASASGQLLCRPGR